MPGLLIFIGIGIIFMTLLKATEKRRSRRSDRARGGDRPAPNPERDPGDRPAPDPERDPGDRRGPDPGRNPGTGGDDS